MRIKSCQLSPAYQSMENQYQSYLHPHTDFITEEIVNKKSYLLPLRIDPRSYNPELLSYSGNIYPRSCVKRLRVTLTQFLSMYLQLTFKQKSTTRKKNVRLHSCYLVAVLMLSHGRQLNLHFSINANGVYVARSIRYSKCQFMMPGNNSGNNWAVVTKPSSRQSSLKFCKVILGVYKVREGSGVHMLQVGCYSNQINVRACALM